MINRALQVVSLAVDLHENPVQVPLPIRVCTHFLDTFAADFSGKHRAKSIPPVPHSFVADVDPALAQQVLDIAERKWKSNVHHDRQTDDLGAAVKVLEGVCFRHQQRLRNRPARLKQICSDKALLSLLEGAGTRPRTETVSIDFTACQSSAGINWASGGQFIGAPPSSTRRAT